MRYCETLFFFPALESTPQSGTVVHTVSSMLNCGDRRATMFAYVIRGVGTRAAPTCLPWAKWLKHVGVAEIIVRRQTRPPINRFLVVRYFRLT